MIASIHVRRGGCLGCAREDNREVGNKSRGKRIMVLQLFRWPVPGLFQLRL